MEIVLEGNKLLSKENFHREVREKLELPDYYGNNLDALWDCLTGYIETPIEIVWTDFKKSKIHLGDYADRAAKILEEAQDELSDYSFIVKN